jgi:hypothetical protein
MDFGRWVDRSLTRARVICFDGFEVRRWLTLAVASWLAWLGTASSNLQARLPSPDFGWDIPKEWYTVSFFLTVAAVGSVTALLLWLLLTWLRSRGQVMFLQLVARNRGELLVLWTDAALVSSDLFRTRLVIDLSASVLMALLSGAGVGTAIALSPDDPLSVGSGAPIAVSMLAVFLLFLCWVLLTFLLDEIALPIAVARHLSVREALDQTWRLLQAHPAEFVVYFLFRAIATLIVGLFLFAIACMTCMVSWIPGAMALVAVPLRVFLQSMSLTFLHELDPLAFAAYAPLHDQASASE